MTKVILKKLPFKTKVGYGAAELSNTLTWTMISVLFLYFLTDVVKMDPAFAGFVLMIGTLWDAVTDPTVGILSDRLKTKWGRRRPFLLTIAVPYGLVTWLLFSDFGFGEMATKVYFILAIALYYTCATLLDVPYTSLAAEMTQDYDERTNLFSFRAVFSQLGSIVAAVLPWVIIAPLSEAMGDTKAGWSAMTAIFGLLTVFPILLTWRATRGYELHPEDTRVSFRDILHGPLKNRTFRYTVGIYASVNVALSVAAAVMVYFMKYYMKFSDMQESLAFLFLFACTIVWIPIIDRLSSKLGKRESFIICIGIWAAIQAVATMLIEPSMITVFYILTIFSSGGVITVTLTGWSLIPDAIEVDEFKSGQRREGLYVGLILFSRKISVAVVLWLIGIVLSKIGYVPGQEQTETAILGIRLLYAEGTAFFLIVSMVLAYLLPMTRRRHQALKEAIQLKNEGKEWDREAIQALL
ncbi:MAG: MFS transporter [Proteobacteria bacterium]|nr:MFS transporter [Pseudomonadota bacterium]